MDKILVEVYIPVLNRTYDILIPRVSQMYEVLELMKKGVMELSDGQFFADQNTVLCYREDGKILNINLSAFELGLENGSKLMMI